MSRLLAFVPSQSPSDTDHQVHRHPDTQPYLHDTIALITSIGAMHRQCLVGLQLTNVVLWCADVDAVCCCPFVTVPLRRPIV